MINKKKLRRQYYKMYKGLLVWGWNPSTKIGEYPPKWVLQFLNNNTPKYQLS